MKIFIAGAGVFGTAMANVIANKHEILLYSRSKNIVDDINNNRRNSIYYPNKTLSKKIKATDDITKIDDADILFLCIPSYAILDFVQNATIAKHTLIVNGAKGFGKDFKFIFQTIEELLPNKVISLKGPSFASELIYEMPTAFTLASREIKDLATIGSLFRKKIITLDYSDNVLGIELMSIVKNVYAIVIGIVDAMYNSANVRFQVFTKAIKEIKNILEAFDCSADLLFHYAGIGDFGLTSLNDLSRNRTLGLLIGKGFLNAELGNSITLEGLKALDKILTLLSTKSAIDIPIMQNLNLLLKSEITSKDFVNRIV
ncbi:MAG: glycerol-3-phosphate dehydrogenase [Pseudopedobacter saltans]|uniref:Glycerol-3-phosphate dehydrogenase n=1 Tax=Pseudopedobacter saltans TaxID=151895 RepID=A0A2W5F3P2_9SPHI|nr:MAG: glycerol-3-phosphate dehydrogenase [Pseudopedobacter saltans]